MAVLVRYHAHFDWDLLIARAIQSIQLPGITPLMSFVSALGYGWFELSLVVAATGALIFAGLRTEGLICIAGIGLGKLVSSLLKLLSGRPRPGDLLVQIGAGAYYDLSFPSGHAMFFMEFFGFLFFLTYTLVKPGLARTAGLLALGTLVVLVGVSRIYLGAHWPSDVLGGYLAGGLWLMLMIETYKSALGQADDMREGR
jgi:undecaprenyl-diphosphatase